MPDVNVRMLLGMTEASNKPCFEEAARRHFELPEGVSEEDALRGVLKRDLALPAATDGELLRARICADLDLPTGSEPPRILRAYIRWGERLEGDDDPDVGLILASAVEQLGLQNAGADVVLAAYLRDVNSVPQDAPDFQMLLAWLRDRNDLTIGTTVRSLLVRVVAVTLDLAPDTPEVEVNERLVRTIAGVGPTAPLSEVAEGWYKRRCGRELTGPEVVAEAVKDCLLMDPASSPVEVLVRWMRRRSLHVPPDHSDEEAFLVWLRGKVTYPNPGNAAPEAIKAAWLLDNMPEFTGWSIDQRRGFVGSAYRDLLAYWREQIPSVAEGSIVDVLDAALRVFEGLEVGATWAETFASTVKTYEIDRDLPADASYIDVIGAIVRSDLKLKDDDSDERVLEVLLGS